MPSSGQRSSDHYRSSGAEVTNFGHKNVHIPEHYIREYERLVMGGIWAQIDMRFEYDEESRARIRSGSID